MKHKIVDVSTPKYLMTVEELEDLVKTPIDEIKKSFQGEMYKIGNKVLLKEPAVKKYLESHGANYGFKVISYINQRGGCGKTTASTSVSSRAKAYGNKVCILDLDPQATASLLFDIVIKDLSEPVFFHVYKDPKNLTEKALKKIEENLYILPSSKKNRLVGDELRTNRNKETAVKNVCSQLKNLGVSLVVIDAAPAFNELTESIMYACTSVFVPLIDDRASVQGLENTVVEMAMLVEKNMKETYIGLLLSRFNGGKEANQFVESLKTDERFAFLEVSGTIGSSTSFKRASKLNQTIFAGSKNTRAREDYNEHVVREVLLRKDFCKRGYRDGK